MVADKHGVEAESLKGLVDFPVADGDHVMEEPTHIVSGEQSQTIPVASGREVLLYELAERRQLLILLLFLLLAVIVGLADVFVTEESYFSHVAASFPYFSTRSACASS